MLKALSLAFVLLSLAVGSARAEDNSKPRVFITDSQSWEIGGYSGGGPGGGGSVTRGGARPQTAEIIKTFGERCPQIVTNNLQQKADYIVLLDHEGGKSFVRHKNKVAVFARVSGDSVVSKSTLSLGGSVQEACEAIVKDWATHGAEIRQASADPPAAPAAAKDPPRQSASAPPPIATAPSQSATDPPSTDPAAPGGGKLSITSVPDGCDIEVDGKDIKILRESDILAKVVK